MNNGKNHKKDKKIIQNTDLFSQQDDEIQKPADKIDLRHADFQVVKDNGLAMQEDDINRMRRIN